jgi:hypothetical protein
MLAACSRGDPHAQLRRTNDILAASASPFEDLTEFAVAADRPGIDRTLVAIATRADTTRAALDPARRPAFDSLLTRLRLARQARDFGAVALQAVEGYGMIVESLADEALTVPKAVSLLDYAGFKLSVLVAAPAPDWAALRETAANARRVWDGVAARVNHTGLRDVMTTTISGMERAIAARNVPMTAFAARVALDLVDLLESYFAAGRP